MRKATQTPATSDGHRHQLTAIRIVMSACRDYTKARCAPQVNSSRSTIKQEIATTLTKDGCCRRKLGEAAVTAVAGEAKARLTHHAGSRE